MLGFLRRASGQPTARIAVTGATGGLGGAVVRGLLARQPGSAVRALGRDPGRLAQLASFGAQAVTADLDDLGSLVMAFHEVDTVLLVPTWDVGQRVGQHNRVVRAARETGVRRIVYVGAQPAARLDLLTAEHAQTEALVQASGLDWTLLRHNLHMAQFVPDVEAAMRLGYHATSIGGGGAALVDRADIARAAVAVLDGAGHSRRTYTLTGPATVSALDVAAAASRLAGRAVPVQHLSRQGMEDHLRSLGHGPEAIATALELEDALREGSLASPTGDLEALTGQPGRDFLSFLRQKLGKAK